MLLQRQALRAGTASAPRKSGAPLRHVALVDQPAALCARAQAPSRAVAAAAGAPAAFLPRPFVDEIEEPAARAMTEAMRRVPVDHPKFGKLDTAFVGPTREELSRYPADVPAFVMLHGFDSSCMEFRRLHPLLAEQAPTYALDLVGWGFTDCSLFEGNQQLTITPQDKADHLRAFLQQHTDGRRVVLVGASLGGAKSLDFAHTYPDLVAGVVLIDAQGFIDGIGNMATAPRPLLWLGVKLLQSVPLRQAANKMAYFNKERFATTDAMRVGRLHTHLPGWTDANIAFMRSGGYAISKKIAEVEQPVLVLWGRKDEILEPSYAQRFADTLPNNRLVWVEECGHCCHLEQPSMAAEQVLGFARQLAGAKAGEVVRAERA